MERRLQDEVDKRNRSIERTKKMFPDKNDFQKIQTQSALFVVSKKLLAQEHDSLLWKAFADVEKGAAGPHCAIPRDDDGNVFLNVPADVFANILTWLEHASVPSNPTERDLLLDAAESLELQRLVEQLRALDEGGVRTNCGRLAADVHDSQPGEGRYATLSDSHTPTNSIAPTSMPIDRRYM